MKKLWKIVVSGILAASVLAGCGSTAASSASSSSTENQSSSAADTSASQATSDADSAADTAGSSGSGSGKTLVLYFSASGTTKKIADMIAKDAGADEYEITPADPYTESDLDYNNPNSRVNKEGADESLQNVKFKSTDVPNWSSYDTVFLGYPIWREDASWVMKSFVKHLDFTGKNVIPFVTSSASDIGRTGQTLASLAGNKGDWQKGKRFSGGSSESDVRNWVSSFNL